MYSADLHVINGRAENFYPFLHFIGSFIGKSHSDDATGGNFSV
jgi:hypothetical protein